MNVFQFEAELGTGYKTYNIIHDNDENVESIDTAFHCDQKSIKSWRQPLEIQ